MRVENNPNYICTGMSANLAIINQRYWIFTHLSTMMGKKGKSDIQSDWKSCQSKTEKT